MSVNCNDFSLGSSYAGTAPYVDECSLRGSSESLYEESLYDRSLSEFRQIIFHPFIMNHPVDCLKRFGEGERYSSLEEIPIASLEKITRKIYHYVQTQNGRVFRLPLDSREGRMVESMPLDLSSKEISYPFFLELYKKNKKARSQIYNTTLECRKIDKAKCGPSELLEYAVLTNYWEVIPSLVNRGGVLSDEYFRWNLERYLNDAKNDPAKAKTEWVEAYKSAYYLKYKTWPDHHNGESSGSQSGSH